MLDRCTIQRNQFLLMTFVWGVTLSVNSFAVELSNDFQRRLQRRISITWSGQSLSLALAGLADHEDLNVWLDRRVDPEQTIELALQDVNYQEVLTELARSCGLQLAYVGDVVYLGPKNVAEEIMALREKLHAELEGGPKNLRKYWLHKSVWSWPRLSEPRKLLQELFSGTPIKLQGVEQIPYDLWDARQLPQMTRLDRTILFLVGFDLMLDSVSIMKECRVVPIDRPVLITRQYPLKASQSLTISDMRQRFPELDFELLGSKSRPSALKVTGTWNAQQNFRQKFGNPTQGDLRKERHKSSSRSTASDRQVYTLEIREQTLHKVLRQLASQLPVELTWDERQLATAGYSLDVRISCKVQSASLEQLLEAILNPVGLQFQRVGKEVLILPAL
jgi:hypothetical protein